MGREKWQVLAVFSLLAVALSPLPAGAVEQPPAPTADGAGTEDFRPLADSATSALAAELGVSPLAKPPYLEALKQKKGPGQYAQEWYYPESGTCLIQIQPAGQELTGADAKFMITHEVVHCYQDRETGDAEVTDWVEEGAATWAAAKLAPGSAIAKEKWGPYLTQPGKSLFSRAYDGVGFFGHLEYVGVDVWTRIVKMMKAGSNDDAAFGIATADNPAALDNWPTGLARESSIGGAWTTSGPDIPDTKPPRISKTVGNGSSATVGAPKAANAIADLDITADVFIVDAGPSAHGRLRDSAGADRLLSEASGRPFCARTDACVCPDGSPAEGIQFTAIAPGTALLGITGGAQAASVLVRGRSLQDYCAKPAKVDPCIVGTWISQGVSINLPTIDITGVGGKGAVLRFEKTGVGSVDFDASEAVQATLPGGLNGTFRLTGQTGGIVNAWKGVMTTLATSSNNLSMRIDVPPLGGQDVPFTGGGAPQQPFDGSYTCSKTTLVYSAPGFGGQSTWTRQ